MHASKSNPGTQGTGVGGTDTGLDEDTTIGTSSRTSSTSTGQGARVEGAMGSRSGPGPHVMAAHTLEGDAVVNRQGESLGDVKAIMIDVPNGKVAYAVLAFGGFLGMGEKLFAIPWSALTLEADQKRFVLDVPAETLKQAPGFDKDHWPTMADQTWAAGIHSYYGRRPYWEV